jgi:quercetin dioxygenase-like cupin family protein
MEMSSLTNNLVYTENKPAITVLLETDTTKEIRIAMKKGQVMRAHKTPFPIVVELFEGKLDFGVEERILHLSKGDIIALEGNVAHDLSCIEECIVRLSISKLDDVQRVKDVVK